MNNEFIKKKLTAPCDVRATHTLKQMEQKLFSASNNI